MHVYTKYYIFPDIGVEIDFLPIVFAQDNIFYEMFSVTVQLFNTTWHDMHAKTSDFNKVSKKISTKNHSKRVFWDF